MDSFVWDTHFITGLTEVDRQHRQLVDEINRFGELLVRPVDVPFDELERVFGRLAAYAGYHFAEEEALMQAVDVDPRHVKHHRQAHEAFLEEVTRMYAGVSPDDLTKARSLQQFLIHWLAYHILGADQSLAKQIGAIRAGQGAAEAFLAEERVKEGAVEPLLHALGGLFQQVSERNRELMLLNQTLEARVIERTEALAVANRHLEELSLTDALTGLPNRRHAMQRLAHAWDDSVRNGTPLVCMMIDADGFKQINDDYGHDAGDEVLRQLARCLQHSIRTDDAVCRLGGDEFLVIGTHTPLEGAVLLAERIRATVAALRVPAGSGVWRGSISLGVAVRRDNLRSIEDLIKAADNGVYLAKKNGRNRVAVAP